ncbi:MAG: putative toxin-antitoxin system toxin component, PIN family [Piscinibacter sp.]|uniref:PIN domain-containing protein n=1 Tax=Piscinibacter sp. TaxID=1903157 RepID=UPI003D0BD31F
MYDRQARTLVLDTNVVLDWLVFRNPAAAPLVATLTDGGWRWYVTADMRAELEQVLTYPSINSWQPDCEAVWATWARWAVVVAAVPAALSAPLRCTDPDDQKFIDLALQLGGATLLSRDRAVLKLARRARPLGVEILTPERWVP